MAGQVFATGTLGGYFTLPKLSKELRFAVQPLLKFRQFVGVKEAFGKNRGDTVEFDKVSNISAQGGTLNETATIPENNFTISKGTIVISEYGNSIPFTGKLEALSEFSIDNAITKTLRNDMAKVLDKAVATQFQTSDAKYVCLTSTSGNLSLNGTVAGTAGANLNAYHVKQIADTMKKANIEKYDGENYICIASVNAIRGLKDDSKWEDAAKYGDPERLFSGEVGRYYGVRFIEENNALSNILGSGAQYGEAVFFGADAVMEGIAIPEEVRAKTPTDYGRSKGLAWYFLGGFKKIWDYTDDGEYHIVHITSL